MPKNIAWDNVQLKCLYTAERVGAGIEFNAPSDTIWAILEVVFTANHLTDIDKQNSTGKYIKYI